MLRYSSIMNNATQLFLSVGLVFTVRRFLSVQKSLGGHIKNSVTL